MSSKKTSTGTLVLLFLLFVGAAGAGWYFLGQEKAPVEDSSLSQPFDKMTPADDMAEADHGHDHDHDHEHSPDTHAHDDMQSGGAQIGDKGTVYDLSVKPLLGRRGFGDPNAPVQVREFFSLTCNHCADFYTGPYQNIKEQFIDTGKLYFIYEEFPLNGPALYGSMIARCLPEERYAGFIDLLLRSQDEWAFGGDFKTALQQNAKLAGMSEEEFDTCFNNEELQKEIATNIKEASDAWNVSSTPTFVFNDGERILRGSQSAENFGQVISALTEPVEEESSEEVSEETVDEDEDFVEMDSPTVDE